MVDYRPMLLLGSNSAFALRAIPIIMKKPATEISLLYIFTATKVARDRRYLVAAEETLVALDYRLHRFDFEEETQDSIIAAIQNVDVVYLEGGNTFYLLKAIRESGCMEALQHFVAQGKLLVGVSAGAYVCCPTIEVATWRRPGDEKPDYNVTDFTAMNLVPFLVKVHYKSEERDELRTFAATASHSLRLLKDGQGLLVHDDGRVEFMGEGEEERL